VRRRSSEKPTTYQCGKMKLACATRDEIAHDLLLPSPSPSSSSSDCVSSALSIADLRQRERESKRVRPGGRREQAREKREGAREGARESKRERAGGRERVSKREEREREGRREGDRALASLAAAAGMYTYSIVSLWAADRSRAAREPASGLCTAIATRPTASTVAAAATTTMWRAITPKTQLSAQ